MSNNYHDSSKLNASGSPQNSGFSIFSEPTSDEAAIMKLTLENSDDEEVAKSDEAAIIKLALENNDDEEVAKNVVAIKADDADSISAPTPTFSSRVVNFFCESAKNRNVQFGTAAVVGAAVGFGLSYVPGVTPLVVDLLGKAAAAMIPPVAALVIVGALVGVLLALAIEFAYDKYQANNTSKT